MIQKEIQKTNIELPRKKKNIRKKKENLLEYLLNGKFTKEQRLEITKAITEDGLAEDEVWQIARPEYSAEGMKQARELLRNGGLNNE
ncbi:hypothetical protein SAMN02745111_02409 [Eubacterium uniforme]|uniref:Uncharacterized protein n=1 Tax=Eubacterium uniforme TaxID=39495 RepID=A0A1T4W638_9FIRM|nr:hypothetical protein [Eubacterium uniforme]SKA72742.1 hypothetical protein SAMN02745111_02409 [Eubacterium uniforme]